MELKALKISEKKIATLHAMNIFCAEDLLTYYPFRYEQIEIIPRNKWEKETKIAIEATIVSRARVIRFRGKQSVTKFKVIYEEEEFEVSIFNRPWVSNFVIGKVITIIGKYEGNHLITIYQYNTLPLLEQVGMHPIYNVKDGISQKDMQKYIEKAMNAIGQLQANIIPDEYLRKYRLIPRKTALYYIHNPKQSEDVKQSLRHLKYEEFLKFQVVMQAMKEKEKNVVQGAQKHFSVEDVMELKKAISFSLTNDQQSVIDEILVDLKSDKVMYRMLQGDVGCGKTLVAAFGLYASVLAHSQAAFMAPTEILAKQHYQNLVTLFKDFDIKVEVLYASLKASEKKAILERLKHNEIDILIGTHALFQEDVSFYNLGMVVADEQHRFGVGQRRRLLEKGDKVDFLLMSATPIPRTLAISLYGDMDVSTIQELPKGRLDVTTTLIKSKSMSPILEQVLTLIDEGNQCYVVCPAIDKNEDFDMRNVTDIYEGMKSSLGLKYHIGLLHGKMSAYEKDQVMEAFIQGNIDILVSTTVIEVGVDVKNANIMVIYDAHRFGLSQIHQLRGRVGRGDKAGYCFLLTSSKDKDSLARLNICVKTRDGFEIAREDLQLRGPGDILGTRQSGVPSFILGDVIQDANILEVARNDAKTILQNIDKIENIELKKYVDYAVNSSTYLD
ncbi:MAG: ATP-dependent DNA helicase RecG [Longicatena sp.]